MRMMLDDPHYPGIAYRRGASGWVSPVLRGTGIRVQTIVREAQLGLSLEQIASEYELDVSRVREAQAFYAAHRLEIDAAIRAEQEAEKKHSL